MSHPQPNSLNLSRFYTLALLLLAILLTLSHALTQNSIARQKDDASIINISGAQRMLSQRLGILLLEYSMADEKTKRDGIKSQLSAEANKMLEAHNFLSGRSNLNNNIPYDHGYDHHHKKHVAQKRLSPRIHEMYFVEKHPYEGTKFKSLDGYVRHYIEDINEALNIPVDELSPSHPKVLHIVEDYPDALLPLLDAVVHQYEDESEAKNAALMSLTLGIYIFMLTVVVALGVLVFRPMERDVKRYTRKLEETNQALEAARKKETLAALGELSGGLAHEINNTLQPVLGLSEIALKKLKKIKDQDTEKIIQYISVLHESALHARRIVENVLIFARGEKTKLSVYEADSVFSDSLSLLDELIPPGIQLERIGFDNFEIQGSKSVYINKTSVTQILINLVKNAVHAMDDKGTITITLSHETPGKEKAKALDLKEKPYVIISIADEGHGIPAKELDNIFTPFYTTKDVEHGTGLGLSAVYGFMRDLNGSINVESDAGKGTVFTLYFPIVTEVETNDIMASENKEVA